MAEPKKRKTTELLFTIVAGIFTAGVGTGIIPPDILEIGKTVIESAQEVSASGNTAESIMNSIYKIVSIVTGGWVVSSYTKSRGQAKAGENNAKAE